MLLGGRVAYDLGRVISGQRYGMTEDMLLMKSMWWFRV